jgi:hypothetical protein
MQNKQRHILEKKLRELPEFQPEESVWVKINEAMDKQDSFTETLRNFPEYTPESDVWNKIEQAIQKKKYIKIYWLAAASVFLVFFFFLPKLKSVVYQESSVVELSPSTTGVSRVQDDTFEEILTLCLKQKEICQRDDFKEIKHEFEHLQNAGNELRSVLGLYNDQPHLREELEKIERQKSQLLEQLTRLI